MATPNNGLMMECVSPDAVSLMRVLILLCLLAIFWSMVGFCLDVIGPTKSSLRFLRRNAVPGIWTVLLVVAMVGVCYLAGASLELAVKEAHPHPHPHLSLRVTYDSGCYAITAAGVVALMATACNLLQEPLEPGAGAGAAAGAGARLLEDLEGLETFSVGMRDIPPPPPYTP